MTNFDCLYYRPSRKRTYIFLRFLAKTFVWCVLTSMYNEYLPNLMNDHIICLFTLNYSQNWKGHNCVLEYNSKSKMSGHIHRTVLIKTKYLRKKQQPQFFEDSLPMNIFAIFVPLDIAMLLLVNRTKHSAAQQTLAKLALRHLLAPVGEFGRKVVWSKTSSNCLL